MGKGEPIALDGLSKRFDDVLAVDALDLEIGRGEFLTLLGASGSGKTTTLMMIAGFVSPTSGRIRIGSTDVTALAPGKRDLGVVFQNYALFPHMSVARNLAFPLSLRGVPHREVRARVARTLDMVELSDKQNALPRELSGGQQQRVALARALIFEPRALLMDEPLGALDKRLRQSMQAEIKRIHERLGTTIVYVTHDQEEALAMSDRIAVMISGHIAQLGAPKELYDRPETATVAQFLGESNLLTGVIGLTANGALGIRVEGGGCIEVPAGTAARPGDRRTLMVRPERCRLVPADDGTGRAPQGLPVRVESIRFVGHAVMVAGTRRDGGPFLAQIDVAQAARDLHPGAELTAVWEPSETWVLPAVPAC